MKTIIILLTMLLSTQLIKSQTNPWKPVVQKYFELEKALVASDSKTAAVKLTELSKAMAPLTKAKVSKGTSKQVQGMQAAINASLQSNSLEGYRTQFSKLSNSLIALSKDNNLWEDKLYVVYCPMKEANWISSTNEVANPYYGKAMLSCGSVNATITPK
ncbi:DUF3347 domain-containing protein [Flavobacterium sp.]|uniref:DUF3347 domain-containing protein n=1 Tax=Flavobacterium sp. TaxID=239 RepID=UPI002FDB8AD1